MSNVDGMLYCGTCDRATAVWDATHQGHVESFTCESVGSIRCYGIELETDKSPKYRTLRENTIFGAKYDGSINGMEFVSPILQGDAGFQAVKDFCQKAKRLGFQVNSDCGYHVHIDMRDTTESQRRIVAYAQTRSYPVWAGLVPEFRARDCNYCHAPRYEASDILACLDFDGWLEHSDRYSFFNFRAFHRHNTYEVRGYQGTLNPVEICAWASAHLRFTDAMLNKSAADVDLLFACNEKRAWSNVCKIIGPNLARYFGRLRSKYIK
jgi:hypothetical protein